ncbi:MAG: hypothetical protein PHD81_04010 [Candidatus Nanoarchaeia archaeon]|nr:hypothetical protein [Candidatus Nanoarchaeia archaeon]MDD5588246.1 hypothetical protein [Candidatus Nanoarchaeia archaeon]
MKTEVNLTEISHKGKNLTFRYPSFRGPYGIVAEQIDEEGLRRPTSAEIASLVYDAIQNPNRKYESRILEILRNDFLWEFTGNLCLPKSGLEVSNGIIIEQNPTIKDRKLVMDRNSLIKRLSENDPKVKFVPFGFKTGEQTSIELEKNAYIIARYGESGAEKVAEFASKYEYNTKLWNFGIHREITIMSTFISQKNNVYGQSGYCFGYF